MPEPLTPTAAVAIKSRLTRARAGLQRLSSAQPPVDFDLIALAVHSVTTALSLPAVTHVAHNLASVSRADALKNLTTLLESNIIDIPVTSMTDLIQAAREIETAVQRAPTLPRPSFSTIH